MHTPNGARDAAEEASRSTWFRRVARAGYLADAVLHLALALICLHVAFGGRDESQGGALATLAASPWGHVLLWIAFLACLALGAWNAVQAVFRTAHSAFHRFKDACTGLGFLAIGAAAGRYAIGPEGQPEERTATITARLMEHPAGVVLLLAVAVALLSAGVAFIAMGVGLRFETPLRRPSRRGVGLLLRVTGVVGYVAKGTLVAVVGLLFAVTTLRHTPQDARGVAGALDGLHEQPLGVPALVALGAGMAVSALFLLLRSRYDKMD